MTNGTAFSIISRKEHNFARYTVIRREGFSTRNIPIVQLNSSLFGNTAIFGFSGNFSKKLPYHLSPFGSFRNFGLNGRLPKATFT